MRRIVPSHWNFAIVDDDLNIRKDVREFLEAETFANLTVQVTSLDFADALDGLRARKIDLVILDLFRGKRVEDNRAGEAILADWKKTGFAPVIVYTAVPEDYGGPLNKFVRLLGKNEGLERLKEEIHSIIETTVPLIYKALVDLLDKSLTEHMWKFVVENWDRIAELATGPDFSRLVLRRLALEFGSQDFESDRDLAAGLLHPAEWYIKPPIASHLLLGDVRERPTDGGVEYLVVLWPSCDLVRSDTRTPKAKKVLCARAEVLHRTKEMIDYLANKNNKKKKKIEELMKNRRDSSPDCHHFLPGVWDILNLVLDFRGVELLDIEAVEQMSCKGTLASPFAEDLAERFTRFLGHPRTPDLNIALVLERLGIEQSEND